MEKYMPTEKELNIILFDQLEIVEDALELAEKEHATETIAYLKKKEEKIKRKLYQNPSLTTEDSH